MSLSKNIDKCNELMCLTFLTLINKSQMAVYFKIRNSAICLRYIMSINEFSWYTMDYPCMHLTLEDVLDLVSDDIKIELLFNLDLFR